MILGLPPKASGWVTATSVAAAISYADRGASAIAASGILSALHWTETELGTVQGAFFLGYGLTQVVGGLLSESDVEDDDDDDDDDDKGEGFGETSTVDTTHGKVDRLMIRESEEGKRQEVAVSSTSSTSESYRSVLPTSLFLTGLTTLFFPWAATYGGQTIASLDRFLLGVFEGLLLPSAMAGLSRMDIPSDKRATASSILIAGCYLGSAFAYLSATLLFSSSNEMLYSWHSVFYVNGVLAFLCLFVFRSEFVFPPPNIMTLLFPNENQNNSNNTKKKKNDFISTGKELLQDVMSVAQATISSVSGRAILAAQIGQGALLYSIASWGPLYLERMTNVAESSLVGGSGGLGGNNEGDVASATAAAAAAAAAALIIPQLTQAATGLSVGAAADALSGKIGIVTTRRMLQGASGCVPAVILWYLSSAQPSAASVESSLSLLLLDPTFLFGAAQTVSALSLGAVSVSHLEVAPLNAGTVYALGNVAAAISGAAVVNIFGYLLESGGGSDFELPFRLVAALSAAGSFFYATTVQSEQEIAVERKRKK